MRLLGGSSAGRTEVLVMGIGPLSKTSPRTSPAVDLDALRIGAAVEHIKAHGNLDGFPAGRGERLALVSTAAKQGLLVWNRSGGRYELTSRGHRRVRKLGRAGRNALRDRQGGAVRSGMNAVVTAAGPSEPEIVAGAAAAPAEKSAAMDRDRPETSKPAHKHKRSGRKGRDGNDEPKTVAPGYAYTPYGGAPTYGHW